jgi:hypothetical protein
MHRPACHKNHNLAKSSISFETSLVEKPFIKDWTLIDMPPKGAPKKSAQGTQAKAKRSPVVGPISGLKWINKVHTAPTQAEGVFISWVSKSSSTASFTKPFKTHFEENGVALKLTQAWKVSAIMVRRDFKDPDANQALTVSPDSAWGWDSFVTIVDAGEDESAETIGMRITESLNEFGASANEFKGQKFKPKYAFCGNPSDSGEGLKPLAHCLLDEDVCDIFKSMHGEENKKDFIMGQDELLKSFFGTAQKGRELLEEIIW